LEFPSHSNRWIQQEAVALPSTWEQSEGKHNVRNKHLKEANKRNFKKNLEARWGDNEHLVLRDHGLYCVVLRDHGLYCVTLTWASKNKWNELLKYKVKINKVWIGVNLLYTVSINVEQTNVNLFLDTFSAIEIKIGMNELKVNENEINITQSLVNIEDISSE